ncbi:MAG: creatininase family protein [Candidatus Aminicenantes bacterium]|nr:MAG: creatininase family protein [Candidatus Aminicenantes bacterium]
MKTIKMEDMNWPDIQKAIDEGYITVVVGVGSIEQHGPHLPTKTDTLIGDMLALRFAMEWGKTLQARTIPVGCSEHHLAFPGTISLKAPTLKAIIADYTESLVKQGFQTIIYLPSHGGNFAAVKEAIKEQQAKFPELKIVGYTDLMGLMDCLFKVSAEFEITQEEAGAHAGENETSLILAFADQLVREDRFGPGYLGPLGDREVKTIIQEGMPALSEIGVLGDPTKASADKGAVYLEKTVEFLIEKIKKQLE